MEAPISIGSAELLQIDRLFVAKDLFRDHAAHPAMLHSSQMALQNLQSQSIQCLEFLDQGFLFLFKNQLHYAEYHSRFPPILLLDDEWLTFCRLSAAPGLRTGPTADPEAAAAAAAANGLSPPLPASSASSIASQQTCLSILHFFGLSVQGESVILALDFSTDLPTISGSARMGVGKSSAVGPRVAVMKAGPNLMDLGGAAFDHLRETFSSSSHGLTSGQTLQDVWEARWSEAAQLLLLRAATAILVLAVDLTACQPPASPQSPQQQQVEDDLNQQKKQPEEVSGDEPLLRCLLHVDIGAMFPLHSAAHASGAGGAHDMLSDTVCSLWASYGERSSPSAQQRQQHEQQRFLVLTRMDSLMFAVPVPASHGNRRRRDKKSTLVREFRSVSQDDAADADAEDESEMREDEIAEDEEKQQFLGIPAEPVRIDSFQELVKFKVSTAHKGWITALSRHDVPGEFAVSGDISGRLTMWQYSGARKGWTLAQIDDVVCRGCRISLVVVEGGPSRVWVGDSSGKITVMQINAKANSMHVIHELQLFTALGGPSTFVVDAISMTAKEKYRLRCFSKENGEAVDCWVSKSVAKVLCATSHNLSASKSRGTVIVQQCAFLAESGVIAVADWQKNIHLWDVSNGLLVGSVSAPSDQCTALAAFERSVSVKSFLLISGHQDGRVHVHAISFEEADLHSQTGGRTHGDRFGGPGGFNQANGIGGAAGPAGGISLAASKAMAIVNKPVFDLLQEDPEQQQIDLLPQEGSLYDDSNASNSTGRLGGSVATDPRVRGGAKFISKLHHELLLSLPERQATVSDIFVSERGGFMVVVFLRSLIHLYKLDGDKLQSKSGTELLVSEFQSSKDIDQVSLVNITADSISSLPMPSAGEADDRLMLLMQTEEGMKLLDCMTMTVLTAISLPSAGSALAAVTMWDCLDLQHQEHVLMGIAATQLSKWFVFNDSDGMKEINTQSMEPAHGISDWSLLEEVIVGTSSFTKEDSPIAAAWSTKSCILLRMQPQGARGMPVTRVKRYDVRTQCRGSPLKIVGTRPMRLAPWVRNHRAIIVLSNGFVVIVNI